MELYGLYRQAVVGDNNTPRPFFLGAYEWDAWRSKRGISSEKAKQDYVNKVRDLVNRIGVN